MTHTLRVTCFRSDAESGASYVGVRFSYSNIPKRTLARSKVHRGRNLIRLNPAPG
jgi:hypothetical protein